MKPEKEPTIERASKLASDLWGETATATVGDPRHDLPYVIALASGVPGGVYCSARIDHIDPSAAIAGLCGALEGLGRHQARISDSSPPKAKAQIEALVHDWDTYGSPPPTDDALRVACFLLDTFDAELMFAPTPHLAPLAGGGVQIEWRMGAKYLELGISPEGDVSYFAEDDEYVYNGEIVKERLLGMSHELIIWFTS